MSKRQYHGTKSVYDNYILLAVHLLFQKDNNCLGISYITTNKSVDILIQKKTNRKSPDNYEINGIVFRRLIQPCPARASH